MKVLLKEKKNKKIVTFDFDDTLSLSHWDEKIDWWVHDGPYDEMIQRFNNFKEKGYIVYIVTSRYKKHENNKRAMSIAKFIQTYNLKPDGIFFTNGKLKAPKLKKLNSMLHHDDDTEEIRAAKTIGIATVLVSPYE
jgi:acid phosphatase class B